jgi:catechol 2,3-dioxygenase-like lactoylglutathione lyase family enzyme
VLHYVSVRVRDLKRSAEFYDALLGPLGWRQQSTEGETISWGLVKPVFYVVANGEAPRPGYGQVSFPANSIPAVKAAWESGLEHGGEGEDPPGAAPLHGKGSYSARLRDPDGYVVEVTSAPE